MLPVGVRFVDLKVEADIDGTPQDVTADSILTVEGESESAAVAVRNNSIVGIRPGEATVKAEFAGQSAEHTLTFKVTETLELDELQVGPPRVTLVVGENTRLDAVGLLKGRSIGIVTEHPAIEWKSRSPETVRVEGPLVSAMAQGTGGVTAQFNNIISDAAEVRVVGEGAITERLTVQPASVTLHPGESLEVGRDVKVLRGDGDLSRLATVAPANSAVVSYDEATRRLTAGLPGQTRVTVVVGSETADFQVTVLPQNPPVAGGHVVIEPASGVVAVGERLPLEVYLISKDGERFNMTASALLGTSDAKIGQTSTGALQGVSPGRVIVTAQVPGADSPATATFDVQNLEFTRLEVQPWRFNLSVGQRAWYEIYAVGPAGRRQLGNDPDLKITHEHFDGRQDALGWPHVIDANVSTNGKTETITVQWHGLEAKVPYFVSDDRITGLVIRPDDASIESGETLDYQVFVRRGGRLDPLSNLDGVELAVVNTVVASQVSALRVRGESPGTTEVIAQYAGQQARSRLRVRPRTTPLPPPAPSTGIRFLLATYQMELGTPGDSVEVVRVHLDGTTENVSEFAQLTADPAGIVAIDHDGPVPMIKPQKIGQTQLKARVGDLVTEQPMLIEVVDHLPGRPRVVVRPSPLVLAPGDRQPFNRVMVIPPGGTNANGINVRDYTVTAAPNAIFEIENDHVIHAKSPGSALATIKVNDPQSKYDGEYTTAIVEVVEPAMQGQVRNVANLELKGPTETTVGSEVGFRVDLVSGGSGEDVTNDASLVLAPGDEHFADLEPGCRLIAKDAGLLNLRARYNGMISNTFQLRINPIATSFRRLELDVKTDPMSIGETRSYRVWGYPSGGGPRQDLTRLITNDPNHRTLPHIRFAVTSGTDPAVHEPPSITAQNVGSISLQAAIGNDLVSRKHPIRIREKSQTPIDLFVQPNAFTSRLGETTPPLKVFVRYAGVAAPQRLNNELVTIDCLDREYLEPVQDKPGQFKAIRPTGNNPPAQIQVTYQNLSEKARVTVVADRFQNIQLGDANLGGKDFDVPLTVSTPLVAGNLDYRVYEQGKQPNNPWVPATAQAGMQFAKLKTPRFAYRRNNLYPVIIEARDRNNPQDIHQYPYGIRLRVIPKNPQNEN